MYISFVPIVPILYVYQKERGKKQKTKNDTQKPFMKSARGTAEHISVTETKLSCETCAIQCEEMSVVSDFIFPRVVNFQQSVEVGRWFWNVHRGGGALLDFQTVNSFFLTFFPNFFWGGGGARPLGPSGSGVTDWEHTERDGMISISLNFEHKFYHRDSFQFNFGSLPT